MQVGPHPKPLPWEGLRPRGPKSRAYNRRYIDIEANPPSRGFAFFYARKDAPGCRPVRDAPSPGLVTERQTLSANTGGPIKFRQKKRNCRLRSLRPRGPQPPAAEARKRAPQAASRFCKYERMICRRRFLLQFGLLEPGGPKPTPRLRPASKDAFLRRLRPGKPRSALRLRTCARSSSEQRALRLRRVRRTPKRSSAGASTRRSRVSWAMRGRSR